MIDQATGTATNGRRHHREATGACHRNQAVGVHHLHIIDLQGGRIEAFGDGGDQMARQVLTAPPQRLGPIKGLPEGLGPLPLLDAEVAEA